jgi:hypothetical protein
MAEPTFSQRIACDLAHTDQRAAEGVRPFDLAIGLEE